MAKYRISVSFDEKNFFWIVIDNGKFIMYPTNEDRMGTKLISYNKTNICPICREESKRDGRELTDKSILYPKNAGLETGKEGDNTREYVCLMHCARDYRRQIYSVGDRRTENQDPNSSNAKGDEFIELVCELYGWENLNEKYDNYRTSIDCYDPRTGLYHQVQGRYYSSGRGWWQFTGLEDEWEKIFEDMVCFCISKDGKTVERIYIFPLKEIKDKKSIAITKNVINGWYKQYRRTGEDELKKANEIWAQILGKRKKKVIKKCLAQLSALADVIADLASNNH